MWYILIIICIILLIYVLWYRTETYIVDIDGIPYNVLNMDKSAQAATILNELNMSNIKLMRHMKKKYDGDIEMENKIQFLLDNYNPEVIFEHLPKGIKNTSYVLNKGDKIYYCLREKNTGKYLFHDMHTLMFVNLHELSHILNVGWGHNEDFWQTFKFILIEAKEAGIHDPIDYSKTPVMYCGLKIEYNPYFNEYLSAKL